MLFKSYLLVSSHYFYTASMTIEQIKEMKKQLQELQQYLHIENKEQKVANNQQLSTASGFWDDNDRATKVLKETKGLEYWINLYKATSGKVEDFVVLFDFWKAGEAPEEEAQLAYTDATLALEDLEFKSTLSAEEDEMPAILMINSGAGGTESQDWAQMLLRMYKMYNDKQGFFHSRIRYTMGRWCRHKTSDH